MSEDKLVVFAHGKESGPWGKKIEALANVARSKDYRVLSPDYRFTMDPEERLAHLIELSPQAKTLVLVGSSMGGYVSAHACQSLNPNGLFLMAPAVYMPGYEREPIITTPIVDIVHGWRDDIVPVDHAIRLGQTCHASLHLLNAGHTLTEVIPEIKQLFGHFLDSL